jgi:hypothetical protein
MVQALQFASAFKLGHYMTIAPRDDGLLSDCRYCRCWHGAARCASVNVVQHRGLVLSQSKRWLYLPLDHRVWYRIDCRKFVTYLFWLSYAQLCCSAV